LLVAPEALRVIHEGESVENAHAHAPALAVTLIVFTPPLADTLMAVGEML
jgi:hypothetical protein